MPPQMVNAYYKPVHERDRVPRGDPAVPRSSTPVATRRRTTAASVRSSATRSAHGFDDQGSRYDGDGRLQDWWTDADRSAFEERTKALIAQYDALVPEGLDAEHHVNGALTIGENIGRPRRPRDRAQGL